MGRWDKLQQQANSLLLLLTVTQTGKAVQSDKFVVVPGQRIGQVRLHEMLDAVEQRLGPSDFGDSALGHHWCTWQARSADAHTGLRNDLDVYAAVKQINGPYIRIVRVTSPRFHTKDGLACGSTLARVQKRYPNARRIARYQSSQVSKPVVLFEATSQGIAFEVVCDKKGQVRPASRCVALLVHVAGKNTVQNEYSPLTSYEVSKPGLATEAASRSPQRKR